MEWNGIFGALSNDLEHAEYDDVYDERGNFIYCDACGEEIHWKNGIYICPYCGKTMSRAAFFEYAGIEPRGEKCLTCEDLYPGCIVCPYGYIE